MNNIIFLLVALIELAVSLFDDILVESIVFSKSDLRLIPITNDNDVGVSDGELMTVLVFYSNQVVLTI